jgi:hypothetical protein
VILNSHGNPVPSKAINKSVEMKPSGVKKAPPKIGGVKASDLYGN